MAHETTCRVRYAETDQMGVVYHANYLIWFEVGRTEHLRSLGVRYRDLEAQGFALAVVEAAARFRAPARYDDAITVRSRIGAVGKSSVEIHYRVLRDGELLCEGHTTHAFLDARGGFKPLRAPVSIIDALANAVEPDW